MKEMYINAELEIVSFDNDDIITTSILLDDDETTIVWWTDISRTYEKKSVKKQPTVVN